MRGNVAFASVLLVLIGCGRGTSTASADDRTAIEDGIQRLAEAFSAGDADRVMAVFSVDPVTLPPNEPLKVGSSQIRAWHEAVFEHYQGDAELTAEEIEVSNDIAYARGTYAMQLVDSAGNAVSDTGKFLMIWMREDGTWKLGRNAWNSDVALPSAP